MSRKKNLARKKKTQTFNVGKLAEQSGWEPKRYLQFAIANGAKVLKKCPETGKLIPVKVNEILKDLDVAIVETEQ